MLFRETADTENIYLHLTSHAKIRKVFLLYMHTKYKLNIFLSGNIRNIIFARDRFGYSYTRLY